ncbi:Zn-ribbon domain-containing OB-fold protein [Candidatus Poriferisocius sp.]|uniref:Zn-ribbon domain-containing OB-fold protein n=1 Tax=Candidatus Poriferisocius sp. TaxID=3101276 RepID=UPI003B5A53EC
MVYFSPDGRPLPTPTPITAPYFDGLRNRRLMLQRCPRHGYFFYPRGRCPHCLGDDWEWGELSGRGTVYSFTVDRAGHDPALAGRIPYVVALVDLDEGPRLVGNVVDCDVDAVAVGMAVEAAYEDVGDATLLGFRPAS